MGHETFSPAKNATAEITEKRSRFIGNISPVKNEQEALDFVRSVKKEYYDAKHSAYAYITDGIKRYSDDGEPSKTAGFPILEMLDAQNISDCVCVVTRYFGGILLGTGGLVRAYTLAAKLALEEAGIKRTSLHNKYQLTIPYSLFDSVKHVCCENSCEFVDTSYTDVINAIAVCEEDKSEAFEKAVSTAFGVGIDIVFIEKVYR